MKGRKSVQENKSKLLNRESRLLPDHPTLFNKPPPSLPPNNVMRISNKRFHFNNLQEILYISLWKRIYKDCSKNGCKILGVSHLENCHSDFEALNQHCYSNTIKIIGKKNLAQPNKTLKTKIAF
eukprot:TRINITY_DN11507_c0_g3_i1.p1 TRINITY_DN11507_c0_g3~~TRINITY_DN11507_c0_g3_i1.p1  ORF type:complete len:124 (+),score=15.33 TRINITY_DN11507_c0_g3_i1:1788-2159(+)